MVRKPELVPRPLSKAANNPPYPVSPTEEHPPTLQHAHTSPTFDVVTHEDARRSRSNSDASSSDWSQFEDDEEEEKNGFPSLLKVGGSRQALAQAEKTEEPGLPQTLRVGPRGGKPSPTIITSSESEKAESIKSPLQSNNPYLRAHATGQTSYGGEDTNAIWSNGPTYGTTVQVPVELPLDNNTPVAQISKLSLGDNAPAAPQSPPLRAPPTVPSQLPASPPSPQRPASSASSAFNPGADISSLDALTSRSHGLPSDAGETANATRTWQEQQAWEKSERERREREAAEASERAAQEEQERRAEEEWHKGEQAAATAAQPAPEEEQPPELPPRQSLETENPPPKPPRPQVNVAATDSEASPARVETPGTVQRRQRNESYQIKHIRWFDSHTDNLREAPILTQNANGPCPLLALVNALVLSTKAGEQSSLVEALRTREQISLGLLLDAVFDELMSGRRGGAAQELPDVSDLYAFLLALHTGMNVNPKFAGNPNLAGVPVVPGTTAKPGGFEETREMRLYSTFNVPLIHGWLPPSESRAFAAFDRSAKTYEDAQNIQFHEEELEVKLSSSGLTQQEQNLYEDLQVIKEFLQRWPTQLTDFGLTTMKNSLKPGQFAILFRNDHFSTIYKEPRSQRILSLVTDAGYSSHEEIVWESLVDVTGRGSELFSGDFRPVSHSTDVTGASDAQIRNIADPPIRSLLDIDDNQGWQTVQPRNQRTNNITGAIQTESGITGPQRTGTIPVTGENIPSRTEQEDADLALALQLQEEEEDRHRREQEARRRRENELSHNFLNQESRQQQARPQGRASNQSLPPLIPPRRNNLGNPNVAATHRPANDDDEPPPPSYEQAAQGPAYHPPEGHPASPFSPAPMSPQGLPSPPGAHGRQQSAYATTAGAGRGRGNAGRRSSHPVPLINRIPDGNGLGPGGPAGVGRGAVPGRASGVQGLHQKDEKCVVM